MTTKQKMSWRPGRALSVSSVSYSCALTTALAEPLPDFSLEDVNSNSARYQDNVSPRDYMLQVSVYYFGAAG